MAEQEWLAQLISLENGKALTDARGEVAYAAEFFRWYAEEAVRINGELSISPPGGNRILVQYQPIGISLLITPWNFPAAMATRKIAPALAAGCTCILKPAEETPLTALAVAEIMRRAGVPAGVINVVNTSNPGPVCSRILHDPRVRKLSFTGSTEVGRILLREAADTVISSSMELGGNAPFLVFDDADLDAAVTGAIASKYRNAGQTCVCANRFYVQAGVYDRFVAKLAEAVAKLKVGAGTDAGVLIGPLIDEAAVAKAQEHVDDALAKGGKVVIGGKRHSLGGRFFEPTILADVQPGMIILAEETFGPVAPIMKFETEAEAIALANASEFGLASYFYARDLGLVWRMAEAIESGIVGINTGLISTEVAPFGGVKMSGLGREGSRHGIEDYLELKYLCIDIG